jgi:hypothetical protein
MIERAVILTRGAELALDAGILDPPGGSPGRPPIETLEAAERGHILKALEACGWRVSGKGGAAEVYVPQSSGDRHKPRNTPVLPPDERSSTYA